MNQRIKIVKKRLKKLTSKASYSIWLKARIGQKYENQRWWSDGGDEKLRYDYPLTKESVVLDVGGYEGEWSEKIFNKYGCEIYIFEPVKYYYDLIATKFKGNKKIHVIHAGLSGKDTAVNININEFKSSVFQSGGKKEKIQLLDVYKFCEDSSIKEIDLIKINIEGGEYELLERMLEKNMIQKTKNIQVQFHDFFDNAEKRMEKIQLKLGKTHKPTYQYLFVWENWERKR